MGTDIELSALERRILERSADTRVTRRRLVSVGLFAAVAATAVLIALQAGVPAQTLGWVAVAHITVTAWEKMGHGFAIIGYKGLIQKLVVRIDELEKSQTGPTTAAPGHPPRSVGIRRKWRQGQGG